MRMKSAIGKAACRGPEWDVDRPVVLRDVISKLQEGGRPFHTLWCFQLCFDHFNQIDMAELKKIISVGDFSDVWPLPFNFQQLF